MTKTATYKIRKRGGSYTLTLELSDDPGEMTCLYSKREAVQAELEACRALGYELIDGAPIFAK